MPRTLFLTPLNDETLINYFCNGVIPFIATNDLQKSLLYLPVDESVLEKSAFFALGDDTNKQLFADLCQTIDKTTEDCAVCVMSELTFKHIVRNDAQWVFEFMLPGFEVILTSFIPEEYYCNGSLLQFNRKEISFHVVGQKDSYTHAA